METTEPMKIRLSNEQIRKYLDAPSSEFPKYTSQLINLANQNAGGTRPKRVGQMSDQIRVSPARHVSEWEKWYRDRHPDTITAATDRVIEMLEKMKHAMDRIDRELVEAWVRDLVIVKTFVGLRFQEAILKRVAQEKKTTYRLATPEEEAKGIDGYIGNQPVSIKPSTYRSKAALAELIDAGIVYYTKTKTGLIIDE